MKAIILSAGQGRRLLPLTAAQPKAALPVGEHSILEWQLRELGQCDIDEAVVVTGFGADHIDDITRSQSFLSARTIYNPFYAQCDNLGTCWIARHEMTAPYLIINGDTLFEAAVVSRLLSECQQAPITLVTDRKSTYDADDMKVVLEGRHLRRVGKQLDGMRIDGESIGMMHFGEQGAQRFRTQIEHMMRHGSGMKQWYLSAIDALAADDLVASCSIAGLSWCEIDDADDLELAAAVVAKWPQRLPGAAMETSEQ